MIYDIAIIGAGPAGVSAAINAKILNKSFIWLSGGTVAGKVFRAGLVENYAGLPRITGAELCRAFEKHVVSLGIEITERVVTGVYETDGRFTLLAGDKDFGAKTVILCLGVQQQKTIEGEEEFLGRGVSYCATCDGNFYRGKTVAVLCADKKFEHETEYLCSLAKNAYVIPLYKDYKIAAKNAEIILKPPIGFTGDLKVKEVIFNDGKISVDGVFILKTAIPPATLVHGLKTEGGRICVTRSLETNIAGIFAAGDCTGRPYQYMKAAGEGNVAVHSAVEYLGRQ